MEALVTGRIKGYDTIMSKMWTAPSRWILRILKVFVTVLIIAGFIYWLRFSPVAVSTYQVVSGPIVAEVMGTGTLEARIATTISPKISGRISVVLVDQGDRVTAGDLLLQLDDEELRQQVAIALANVEAAAAAIERLKTDKNRANAMFVLAQKNHARSESLLQRNTISQEEFDRAIEALAVAVAGVSRSEAGITEGQKELTASERTLEYHRARLMDTQIKAPFDGLIVKRNRELGDVVVPGSSMLTLISTDELWISAWVDETDMARLQSGQSARVVFRSESDRSHPGKVIRLGREVDRETREFIVDVEILELPENWAVGQRAEVFIEITRKAEVILVPSRFISQNNKQTGVFTDENGVVAWRPIELGLRSHKLVEVKNGLILGANVIRPNVSDKQLRAGQRIAKQ
jgi:HlyD family secretion protein